MTKITQNSTFTKDIIWDAKCGWALLGEHLGEHSGGNVGNLENLMGTHPGEKTKKYPLSSNYPFFFFFQQVNLIGLSLKKMKLWRVPKIEGSLLMYRVPPHWPTYIGERRATFAKAYGIKVRCIGEHVGEHIKNLGNVLGT